MTGGQRWRRKRDLAMAAAALHGASQRFLGDVFDLNASRINRVLADLRSEFAPSGGLNLINLEKAIRALRTNEVPSEARNRPVRESAKGESATG